MGKGDCVYASVCLVGGIKPGCNQEGSLTCGEALKRKRLAAQPCPLMKNGKGCDMPQLLAYVPLDAGCCKGGKCLLRAIVPETATKIAASNGIGEPLGISSENLKMAGRAIISSKIFLRKKLATEEVGI
jgi:hypothetical protein